MVNIEIQNAKKEMYPSIRQQRIDAYNEYANVLPVDHWNALKNSISSKVDEQEGVDLIVATILGKIVGSVALFPAKTNAYEGYVEELDYPEIRMLAVDSTCRGQGVANALISECINRTKEKGFEAIGLHTGEFMKNAISLYEGIGFKRLPKFDFQPADDGINVRAYQLKFRLED
ncbi:GNAT family N-acetyltransferase [Bacillus sp. AFS002410]|uniref:GNAT family N-acetyltransferase n=1 Tax=Bacillus sp. AFS002410 TaxID=2033481 RepID=UPI000BF0D592|nr:GNAT family N-acetyltransferase [Bacillus sp. AFS002410]PEJ59187.1 GNAT family N-acetyltransferase [Bacillus sp. AFS002410]